MKTRFLIVACAFLFGCATSHDSTYQAPSSSPTAQIKPINETGLTTIMSTYIDVENCKDRREIFKEQTGEREYRSIQANEPFIFTIVAHAPERKYCNITGTFTPKENGVYDLIASFSGETCLVELYENGVENSNIPFRKLRRKMPFDNSGSWCAY